MNELENLSTREALSRLQAMKRLAFARTFVEPHIRDASKDPDAVSLLPNHVFTLASYALVQLKVKSRKIADSWGLSLYALAQCATSANSQVNIGSYDEEEAQNKLNYLDWIYSVLPVSERRELRMSDGSEKRKFSNGSEIRFLTRKAPTGANGDYLGDEFSVEPKGKVTATEILTAVLGGLTHKGSCRLTGTQRGEHLLFYKIYSGEWQREMTNNPVFEFLPKVEWEIGEFPWWESPALSVDPIEAAVHAPHMATPDRVIKYGNHKLKQQYVIYLTTPGLGLPIFQREFELKVVSEGDHYFELDEIRGCMAEKGSDYFFRHDTIDGSNYQQDNGVVKPAYDHIDALAQQIKGGRIRGDFGYGMDIGRHYDRDAIMCGHNLREDKYSLCARLAFTLENMPFAGKKKILEYMLKRLPITKGLIDATRGGIGVQLGEEMEVKYQQRARGIQFTNANKQIWATGVKVRFSNRKMVIPWCPRPDSPEFALKQYFTALQTEMLKLKKNESASGVITFDVERSSDGHGDVFWAGALWNDLYPPMPDAAPQSVIVVGRNGKPLVGVGNRPKYGNDVNNPRIIVPGGRGPRKIIR